MKLTVERLESRLNPSDINPVKTLAPIAAPPPFTTQIVAEAPVKNADGSVTEKFDLSSNGGLGAGVLISLSYPKNVVASQDGLIGVQVAPGFVRVAYAKYQADETFNAATFTVTYQPAMKPVITLEHLSPGQIGVIDTTALDAFFATLG